MVPAHTENEHFYKVSDSREATYPSVTGRLQILKDESLINYKMNRALEYVFAKFSQLTPDNLMEHLDEAAKVSGGILKDAGDIGTRIHNARERYFTAWIKTGVRPANILDFEDPQDGMPYIKDVRLTSGLNAIEKFVTDTEYVPVATELLLFNHDLKVGGTLDDLGVMWWPKDKGNPHCKHEGSLMTHYKTRKGQDEPQMLRSCLVCGYRAVRAFVLMDIKTSNQFKDHYFFQVAIYYWMFYKLTGIRPQYCFILKASKDDGRYKIEDLKRPAALAAYARSMLRTHEGMDFIKKLRKDNQKVVAEVMEL